MMLPSNSDCSQWICLAVNSYTKASDMGLIADPFPFLRRFPHNTWWVANATKKVAYLGRYTLRNRMNSIILGWRGSTNEPTHQWYDMGIAGTDNHDIEIDAAIRARMSSLGIRITW